MNSETQIETLLRESNLIEGYDRPDFDKQALLAWEYIVQLPQLRDLSHHDIKKVQKILTLLQTDMQPDWRGYYRKIDVWVGDRKGGNPAWLDRAMTEWLADMPTSDPIAAHVAFEKIHPFVDGNGRTGRLLMWWQQLCRGEPFTVLTAAERQGYYRWFK